MKPDEPKDQPEGETPPPLRTGGFAMGGRGGPEDELLIDGQEEVFSRAEVEMGRIEHGAQAGGAARDPHTCRRALREIGEIAAVAILPDSQMTDQEALQNIAAIAEWVRKEAPASGVNCGDVIRQLSEMTALVDIEALGDREALDLFSDVLGTLESSDANVFNA